MRFLDSSRPVTMAINAPHNTDRAVGIYWILHPAFSLYRGTDKSLARPTSRCILFDGENVSFDAGLVIYINSTNISPIMITNKINENKNLLSL